MASSTAPHTAKAAAPTMSILPSTAPPHHPRHKALATMSMGVYNMCYCLFRFLLITCLLFFHPNQHHHSAVADNSIVFELDIATKHRSPPRRIRRHWDPGIVQQHRVRNRRSQQPQKDSVAAIRSLRGACTQARSTPHSQYKQYKHRRVANSSNTSSTPSLGHPSIRPSCAGKLPIQAKAEYYFHCLLLHTSRRHTSVNPVTEPPFASKVGIQVHQHKIESLNFLAVESVIPVSTPSSTSPLNTLSTVDSNSKWCCRAIKPPFVKASTVDSHWIPVVESLNSNPPAYRPEESKASNLILKPGFCYTCVSVNPNTVTITVSRTRPLTFDLHCYCNRVIEYTLPYSG